MLRHMLYGAVASFALALLLGGALLLPATAGGVLPDQAALTGTTDAGHSDAVAWGWGRYSYYGGYPGYGYGSYYRSYPGYGGYTGYYGRGWGGYGTYRGYGYGYPYYGGYGWW